MDPRISRLIDSLPTLTKDDVDIHDYCPICFVDFKTILDDDDSEGAQSAGITKLVGCSHVFCRKDLIQWIRSWHGSCPTCRNIFLSNLHPDSESEDESDGGEYDPNEHEEEEDNSFDTELEEDPEAFGEEEEFEEEDDHAMGLGITNPDIEEFYNHDDELIIEAATARQEGYVEEQVLAAEAVAARIEAEFQDFVEEEEEGFFDAEEFSYEEPLEEEEARRQSEEAEAECADPLEWDIDSEDLTSHVTDSFEPEEEEEALEEDIHEQVGDEVGVEAYDEFV